MRQQGEGRWTPRAEAEAQDAGVRDPRTRAASGQQARYTRAFLSRPSLAVRVPVGRVSVYASEMSLVRERALSERTPPQGTLVFTA